MTNSFENFVTLMDILITNESYTFMKAGLDTEMQLWTESEKRGREFGHSSGFCHLLAV